MRSERGQIITFYSFKGGVGRSMALANVATLLAQRQKRVLVLDFDFEAPGLHRYFLSDPDIESPLGEPRFEPIHRQRGIIDLFRELRRRLRTHLPPDHEPGEEAGGRALREIVAGLLRSKAYKYRVRVRNPNEWNGIASLDFIAAGRFDDRYVDHVRAFNWKRFYSDHAEVFPILAEELTRRYDYVLIDSRTGFTDVGSLCTMVLPDKLVLVFAPNEQSLAGVLDVGEQAVRERSATDRPALPLFPLISRLEDTEEKLKRAWIKRARDAFEALFREACGAQEGGLDAYFDRVRIYHRGYYAYGEHIAAEEERADVAGSMAESFRIFADCLERPSAVDVRPGSQEPGELALLLSSILGGSAHLTRSRLNRLTAKTTPDLLRKWREVVESLPADAGAMEMRVAAMWREAVQLRMAPPIAGLGRRIDRKALAQTYREKKSSWRCSPQRPPTAVSPRALAAEAEFRWEEGAWDPTQPLAGPLFELVWDALHSRNGKLMELDGPDVRWWNAAGGVLHAESPALFPWPFVDLPVFSEHERMTARWSQACSQAAKIHAVFPEEDGPADDLAYWYVEYLHALWHTGELSDWRTGVEREDWSRAVHHLADASRTSRESDRPYSVWARAIPLLAAPESGLSPEAAAGILAGAQLDDAAREALRELRVRRAACASTRNTAELLAEIDEISAGHPWIEAVEKTGTGSRE